HLDDDVQMSGRTTGDTGFTLSLQPELLASGDACGNLHRDFPLARHVSRTAAALTRLGNHAPRAAALRAGAGHDQKTALRPDLTGAVAARARRRAGARGGARAVAGFALLLPRNLDDRFRAVRGFLKRDLEVVAEIGAALRPATPPAAAEQIA